MCELPVSIESIDFEFTFSDEDTAKDTIVLYVLGGLTTDNTFEVTLNAEFNTFLILSIRSKVDTIMLPKESWVRPTGSTKVPV
jgi:hypothetical protein